MSEADRLRDEVVNVLQGVLIHQRQRWATLLGHRRNYEAWWKAEFALALENWAWSWHGLRHEYGVLSEAKPRRHKVKRARAGAVDLLVAPYDTKTDEFIQDAHPRVWIELKERASWWRGNANKLFGASNGGLASDIKKWKDADWKPGDVLLACQIMTYDGPEDMCLPAKWEEHLSVTLGLKRRRIDDRKTVTYPLPGTKDKDPLFRHCSLDVYQLYPA